MSTPLMMNSVWHEEMLGDLVVAGLSERTREASLRAVRQLATFYSGRSPETLEEQDVREYLLWMEFESFHRIRAPPLAQRKESAHAKTNAC